MKLTLYPLHEHPMNTRALPSVGKRLLTALLLLTSAAACAPASSDIETSAPADRPHAQATAPVEPAPAPGTSEPSALRSALLNLFSGYEHQPTDAELRALAEPASLVDELIAMLADPDVRIHVRMHALRALQFFVHDDPRVMTTYIDLLESDDVSGMDLHVTLRSFAAGMAKAQRADEALPHIEPWLQSEDYSTRATAIAALSELGTPRALAALERHRDAELEPALRATLDRALGATASDEVLR